MIEFINHLSVSWANYFGVMNIQNSIFIGAVLILLYLFRTHNPRFLRIVGLLALIKLFIPPLFPLNSKVADALELRFLAAPITVAPNIISPSAPDSLTIQSMLFLAWGVIAFVMLSMILYRHFQLLGVLKSAQPLNFSCPDFSSAKNVQVYRSRYVHSPFVIGLFKHRIVLPCSAGEWPEEHVRTVLAHESAHIKYFDHWINLLQALSQVIYYFNPLVWILNRRLNYSTEVLCDDAAVCYLQQTSDKYTKILLDIAARIVLPRAIFLSTIFFASSSQNLKKRILYQFEKTENFSMKKWMLRHTVFTGALILLIVPLSCDQGSLNNGGAVMKKHQAEDLSGLIMPEPIEAHYIDAEESEYEGIMAEMVHVAVLVGTDGCVKEAKIMKSVPRWDKAALEAAKKYKFKPAMKNGKPVEIWIGLPFHPQQKRILERANNIFVFPSFAKN